jgi:hypothetical protein
LCFEAIKAGTCSPKDGKGNAEFNPSVGIRSDGEALFNIIASKTGDLQRALTHMSGYPSKNGAQLLEFLIETAVGKVTTSVHSFRGYYPGSQVQSRNLPLDLARRFEIQSKDFKDLLDLIASPEPSVLIQASAISQKQHPHSESSERSGKLHIQKNAVCFFFEKKGVYNKGVNCPFMHQALAERESHQAKSNLQQGAIQGEKESKKLKTDVGDKVKEEWSW